MNKIILTQESVTYASRARKLLSLSGIKARIVKIDPTYSDGCVHGVEIYEKDLLNAAMVLKSNGIGYEVVKGLK